MIASNLSRFLLNNGAKIEPVITEVQDGETPSLFNRGFIASGLEVQLNCNLLDMFTTSAIATMDWTDTIRAMKQLFTQVINARVQATLVEPEHCQQVVAKLDSIDQDGNCVKVRFAKGVSPVNRVVKIGGEVYGVIVIKSLATRHRLILDRPIPPNRCDKATPVYGCGVPERKGTNFAGVTIVSNPLDDDPAGNNVHQSDNGLHVRILHRNVGDKSQYAVETICGLVVDKTVATLRGTS